MTTYGKMFQYVEQLLKTIEKTIKLVWQLLKANGNGLK